MSGPRSENLNLHRNSCGQTAEEIIISEFKKKKREID